MENQVCCSCKKPKAPYECGLCHEFACKSCTQFLGEDYFTYLRAIPADLKHTNYCPNCFNDKVAAIKDDYDQTMEKAKEIIIYSKDQSKLTRLLNPKSPPYHVDNCEDEQEALMRMSFFAVQDNFNCLMAVQLKHSKIIVGSHKKTIYSGEGTPITIDPTKIRGHIDPP
jgi:hypothetical protein